MIYTQYSSKGVTVDLVGHSMGGLIIRSALRYTQQADASFPPYLYVEDVVTFGTPHSGSGYASWCPWAYECNQMETGSSYLTDLAAGAPNPQGSGGTDWTAVGSYSDGVVSQTSATAMDATHKVRYLSSMGIGHSDYMNDTSDVRDADVEYYDRGSPWYAWYDAPHAVRWSDNALLYGSW
jgi:pimeloyl-ACP methyl ester carboxylesterase